MNSTLLSPSGDSNSPQKSNQSRIRLKWAFALLFGVGLSVGSYFMPSSLFKADLTEDNLIGAGDIYISTHTGSNEGVLKVRAQDNIASFDAIAFDLTFPAGDLVFPNDAIILDETTLLQPSDVALKLSSANNNKVTLTLLLSQPVEVTGVIPANKNTHPTLFKIRTQIGDVAAGDTIDLGIENFGIFSGINDLGLTMTAEEVVVESGDDFEVEYAQVLSDGETIVIHTNDLVSNIGSPVDYEILLDGDGLNPVILPISVSLGSDAGYTQNDIVLTVPALDADSNYTVQVFTPVQGNTKGALLAEKSMASFTYPSTFNTTQVESVTAVSSNSFEIKFSGAISAATLTPINLRVFTFNDEADLTDTSNLTITSVTAKSGNIYTIKTNTQTSGTRYFVEMTGVKNNANVLLTNQKVLSFEGFEATPPVPLSMTPVILSSSGGNVVISGTHLDKVLSVKAGNTNLTFSGNATTLTATVPANLPFGSYPIQLIWSGGTIQAGNLGIQADANDSATTVVSAQSKSIPSNVPNDGSTKSKIWVLLQGPDADDYTVTINLSQINGASSQLMQKDTGTQPSNGQWYVKEITVPKSVATQSDPYLLPVRATHGEEVLQGTASIRVTADLLGSVAPDIVQAYTSPVSIAPDGKTMTQVFARVEDEDGANTVTSVTADLGTLGLGFVPLTAENCVATEGQELSTCFFKSAQFMVPVTTPEGKYTFSVVATDSAGNTANKSLSLTVTDDVTGPSVTNVTLSTRSSIPNDGTTPFSIFATVSDPDGIADVTSVLAYPSIDSEPVILTRDAAAPASAKSALYSAKNLTIPTTAFTGSHTYNIEATDASGLVGNAEIEFAVTNKDTVGEAPRILVDKAYTSPRLLINDGKTPGTLYVAIQDKDNDITQVIANLANIGGQQGTQTQNNLTETSTATTSGATNTCTTNSTQLPCLQLAFKEGDIYWYILKNLTLSSSTSPGSQNYIDIIVTDKGNKTDNKLIPIVVTDGVSGSGFEANLKAVAAVPISATSVQIVFNQEVDPSTVKNNLFEILDLNNAQNKLPITTVSTNATHRIITLTTAEQVPNHPYIVTFKDGLKDVLGQVLVPGGENRLAFKGFIYVGKAPEVSLIEAVGGNTIQLEFNVPLNPSTLPIGGPDYSQIKVYEEGTWTPLRVVGVNMLSDKMVEIATEGQKAGKRYVVELTGVRSYDGILANFIKKIFKGVGSVSPQLLTVANAGDLDKDGDVDFNDFTLFSSVYGSTYSVQQVPVSSNTTVTNP